jgi:cytochrome c biogenesis factor
VWYLTILVIAVAAVSAGLIAWRWRRFASDVEFESLASREFLYYLTNLLLTMFALAIAFATIGVPLLFERTVGPSTYDTFRPAAGWS